MKIILDTETTGLDPLEDRIIEIAAIEWDGLNIHSQWHALINPMRPIPMAAQRVHGISNDMLAGKPPFKDVALEFLGFIGQRELIAHNAPFDIGFLNAELRRALLPELSNSVIDSLALSKAKGKGPHSLDALCKRYGIDTSARTKHNAILDCRLLAEVMVELTGGRQKELGLKSQEKQLPNQRAKIRPSPLPPRINEAEAQAFEELKMSLGKDCAWERF